MSEALEILHRRLNTAGELKSVVRTMKTLAAVSSVPFERAARSLTDYYHAIELGLIACFGKLGVLPMQAEEHFASNNTAAVVFGSDQGMVGQFNEVLADFVLADLKSFSGIKRIWPVGERIAWRLNAPGFEVMPVQSVPDTISGITPITAAILSAIDQHRERGEISRVFIFHNQPSNSRSYCCARQQLLPFNEAWIRKIAAGAWPTKMIPQVMPVEQNTLEAFLREYLFVSLFRACAESLVSENASRLAAMQSAERKIGELIEQLQLEYNQARQSSIDEELFDVITGYEALSRVS